jgi:hypothetical protein
MTRAGSVMMNRGYVIPAQAGSQFHVPEITVKINSSKSDNQISEISFSISSQSNLAVVLKTLCAKTRQGPKFKLGLRKSAAYFSM